MSSQKGNLVAFIFSTCLIVAHCVHYEYEDHNHHRGHHYVDPSDMGSYSHSMQRNMITTNRRLQHDAQIDEISEKRTIYHSHGIGMGHAFSGNENYKSADIDGIRVSSAVSSGGLTKERLGEREGRVEVIEKNFKYKKSSSATCPSVDEASVMIYTRRIVASLLRQMNVRSHIFGPNEAITIDLQAELSHEDFKKLDKFISNDSRSGIRPKDEIDAITELATVTDIIGNLLHYVYPEPTITWWEYVQEKINFQYLCSLKFWINFITLSAITILVVVLLHRACTSANPLRVLFHIFLLFLIISCVSIFRDLYETARAENHARLHQYDRIPKDCNYNDFGVLDSLGYYIRVHVFRHKDQCVDYHKQMLGETFYHVSPVEAISETLSKLIFHPMEYIGEKSGKFFGGIVAMVPFWLQPVLLVLVFVFGFLALFRYRITSPFISIEPAAAARCDGRRCLEGSPIHEAVRSVSSPQGQAIIEKPARDIVRTSTGIDVGTSTDDLEDYIRSRGAFEDTRPRTPILPVPTWWTLLLSYFWNLYEKLVYCLNILLREVPNTEELVLDDEGAFQYVDRREHFDDNYEQAIEGPDPDPLQDQREEIDALNEKHPEPAVVNFEKFEVDLTIAKEVPLPASASTSSSSRNTPIFDRPPLIHSHSHSSNEWVYVDNDDADNGNENPVLQKSSSFSRPRIIDPHARDRGDINFIASSPTNRGSCHNTSDSPKSTTQEELRRARSPLRQRQGSSQPDHASRKRKAD